MTRASIRRPQAGKLVALALLVLVPAEALAHCGVPLSAGHRAAHHAHGAPVGRTAPDGILVATPHAGACSLRTILFTTPRSSEPGVQMSIALVAGDPSLAAVIFSPGERRAWQQRPPPSARAKARLLPLQI